MRYLVAIDGSDQAFDAARVLTHLSPSEHTLFLHAVDIPRPSYPALASDTAQELYHNVELRMREKGERLVQRAVSLLPNGVGLVESRVEGGSAAEVILSTAERELIDLIIMGARGLGPAQALIFGSVSLRVATHASCAVLTVPVPMPALRRVLLAVEGQQDAGVALQFLTRKPFNHPVEVYVLTVLALPFGEGEEKTVFEPLGDMTLRSAQRFVEDIAGRLSTLPYCAMPVSKVGPPAATILTYAEELRPDLIIIGSHTRNTISRFPLGSISHKILHGTRLPVLTLR